MKWTILVAILLLPTVVAQNDTDTTIEDTTAPITDLIDRPDVPSLLEDAGSGVEDGTAQVGDFVGRAIAAVGRALASAAGGLTTVSGALALASGAGALWLGGTTGQALIGIGAINGALAALVGTGLAAAATGIGHGFVLIGQAYGSIISAMRPDAMPPIAFGAVVATGAAGSAGAGSWAGWNVLKRWGWVAGSLPGVAGFSRIQNDQLLEHPVRSQIFNVIQDNPGIHASKLARDVGVGWGTVSHHLDKLTKGELVATRKVNNQNCFFEQGGTVSRGEMEVASAVKGDTAGRIASFVHSHPLTSQKALADALGISPALASFHAKKLVGLGVLEKMRHGKETLLTTSQAMHRLLDSDRNLAAAMTARAEQHMDYSA